jgi:zinc protease
MRVKDMGKNSLAGISLPTSFVFERTFQGIDEFILHNGLRILLFEDPSQANVTINLTYLVGSRHEGRGEAGMAHLLEHMLFRGTKETRDIKAALQVKGAQYNATTWFDRTNYFETLPPTEENLEFALRLEADRMINSLILQEDLDAEMTVVRNEFEMGENNPVHVLHDQLMSSAYRWHNYGKTTIGNRSDIERVPVKSLRKFYEHYYQPDNAVLIVAGQFSKQVALNLIHKYFADLERPIRTLDETYTEEPVQDGPREVILERVGDVASVAVGYHIPATCHKDHAALKIFFDCITDEPGGLIYQQLVEKGLCSEVFSMVYSLYEPGMALCFVRPTKEDDALTIRNHLVSLVEKKAVDSIDEAQVERMKKRAEKRIKLSMANSKDLALKLSEAIACGDWRLFFWHREQLKTVTVTDVKWVAERYAMASNRTVGVFLPKEKPSRSEIERAPAASMVVADIVEDPSLLPGEIFLAEAKSIEQVVMRKNLSANTSIAFLPKKTRGQLVRAQLRFRFGNESALLPHIKEFWLIPSLLWRGTAKYNYQTLRDRVDGFMSMLEIDGHAGIIDAAIKSEHRYMHEMFALLSHMLNEPAFDEGEFAIVKQREIDNYEEIKNDPQRLGYHELERLRTPWPKDSFHYVHTFDEIIEMVKSTSVKTVKEAYFNLFSAQKCYLAVVGDGDFDKIISEIPGFSNKVESEPYERVKRPFIPNLAKEVILDTKDKEMAILAYAFNFQMRDDHEDFPALKLANYMFGEHMNSRLMNRIREKEGISYGAGSSIEISRHEENASFSLYAMSAPSSVRRAQHAINDEWDKFIHEGVGEHELASAKESIWLGFTNRLANDGFLVTALAHDLEIGRTFIWREGLYLRMKELSAEDIKNAVDKWWGRAQFSKVIAADVAKMK